MSGGRLLGLGNLEGTESQVQAPNAGSPDQTFDLELSSAMMSEAWMINWERFGDAEPLEIREGEGVRVRMLNRSMRIHPMHLHGHFFEVGGALKETVMVPPRMGRITFDFTADNPGDWLFHCHNLYHLEAGMARVFRYA